MKFGKDQFILIGLAAHILAAIFTVGAHQCDEIFQVYEFAGYKMGLNTAAELPWEFHEQMRSGIQPFIVYFTTKAFYFISVKDPFFISEVIRTIQALFSFFVMLKFLSLMEKEFRSEKYRSWLYGFSLLFWCMPYFHARFNSENFSATFFLLGLVFILKTIKDQPSPTRFLLAGIAFGIAFESRFQSSFMIVGLVLWLLLIRKIKFKFILILGVGLVLSLGIGLVSDYWLYNKWTLSWWNYLDLNLFKDKASQFGREPLYFYFEQILLQLIPPFSLLIIAFVFAFWFRFTRHVVTWITLPFILLHFFVAHKELRFLFPALNFLPFMLLFYFQSVETNRSRFITFLKSKGFLRFAVTVNVLILLYYTFKPADNTSSMLRTVYNLTGNTPLDVLYEDSNPYTNRATLHYFRNPAIKTVLINDSIETKTNSNVDYFAYNFNGPEIVIKNNTVFVKHYSSFPFWFKYLNFNGWVERSDPFEVYTKPLVK